MMFDGILLSSVIDQSKFSLPKTLFEFVEFFWFEQWDETTEFLWNKTFADIRCTAVVHCYHFNKK